MRLRNQMPAESRMVLPCRNPAPNLFGIGHNRSRADVRLHMRKAWEVFAAAGANDALLTAAVPSATPHTCPSYGAVRRPQ